MIVVDSTRSTWCR